MLKVNKNYNCLHNVNKAEFLVTHDQLQFAIVPVDFELVNGIAKVASSRKVPIVSLFPILREASKPRTTAD